MKRTFVVPEAKEAVYEKFKDMVPEVSAKLVELIEDYVVKNEKSQAEMVEQTIHEGEVLINEGIFLGKSFTFYGVEIAKGVHGGFDDIRMYVFLTRKNKFLVSQVKTIEADDKAVHEYKVYDSYAELKENVALSISHIKQCEEYLKMNSNIRTTEFLDI